MTVERHISLPRMETGQKGKVVDISGGQGVVKRLAAMGIRAGQTITKKESVFARGPVVVRVNSADVAIGYGMAEKVLVEVEEA